MERDPIEVLTGVHSWHAREARFRNRSFLSFRPSGSGRVVFGIGSTLFADLPVRFELRSHATLVFGYEVEEGVRAGVLVGAHAAYEPRETEFTLHEVRASPGPGEPQGWILRLGVAPFPAEIDFPAPPPLEYFGYVQSPED